MAMVELKFRNNSLLQQKIISLFQEGYTEKLEIDYPDRGMKGFIVMSPEIKSDEKVEGYCLLYPEFGIELTPRILTINSEDKLKASYKNHKSRKVAMWPVEAKIGYRTYGNLEDGHIYLLQMTLPFVQSILKEKTEKFLSGGYKGFSPNIILPDKPTPEQLMSLLEEFYLWDLRSTPH